MSTKLVTGHLVLAALILPLLACTACEKSPKAETSPTNPSDTTPAVVPVADGPVDTTPLPNVDVSKLDPDKQKLFYKLVGTLSSPCGKAHSLRTSFTTDQSCRRAPFAVRYVEMLLGDDAGEDDVIKAYTAKYKPSGPTQKFDVSKAPHAGPEDAPIRFVEFFDYGCPHCKAFKPMMDQVLKDESGKVVTYYLMFPLEQLHHDSRSAAAAVLAANAQGKFEQMHEMLFDRAPAHDHASVSGYAKDLGLDMAKFEKDYDAMNAQVTADEKQGETANVDSTPTLYFNDRKYDGPFAVKYLEAWIEEELAVNR
nr:thioredoxin domain-containing protein [Kofleriaceae bacterium]